MKSKVRTNLPTRDTKLLLIPLSNISLMEMIE
jgi:hypothetical protein